MGRLILITFAVDKNETNCVERFELIATTRKNAKLGTEHTSCFVSLCLTTTGFPSNPAFLSSCYLKPKPLGKRSLDNK